MSTTAVATRWIALGSLLLCFGGCGDAHQDLSPSPARASESSSNSVAGPPDGHSSRNAVDWSGRYRGLAPCADCEAIDTVIVLNADETYARVLQYRGRNDPPVTETGSFTWSADGSRVTLGEARADGALQYQVGENILFQLDRAGNRITGPLASRYELAKNSRDPAIEDIEWRLAELNGVALPSDDLRSATLILSPTDARAAGSTSCNRFNGAYDVLAGRALLFSPNLAVTRMACPDGAIEAAYLDVLPDIRRYGIRNDGRLALSDASDTVRAVFTSSAPQR